MDNCAHAIMTSIRLLLVESHPMTFYAFISGILTGYETRMCDVLALVSGLYSFEVSMTQ